MTPATIETSPAHLEAIATHIRGVGTACSGFERNDHIVTANQLVAIPVDDYYAHESWVEVLCQTCNTRRVAGRQTK